MPINVGDLLVARYDWAFVAGSYVISVLGSFAALHHTPYLFFRSGKINWNMAIGAAVSLGGIGIWAMHFIGMMGYRLALPVVYDAWWTFVSLAAAIIIAGIALIVAGGGGKFSHRGWLLGSAMAGTGVCVMHYLGMYAMNLRADMALRAPEVLLSVLIAVLASGAALWLAFHVTRPIHRVVAAMTMGLAVSAVHYTGMAAGEFVFIASKQVPQFAIGGDALPVVVTTFAAWVLVMLFWNLLRAGKIRALGGAVSRMPIIATTAHALAGEREKCVPAGMDDSISKPIRAAAVHDPIERWSAGKSSTAPTGGGASQVSEFQVGFDASVLSELRELDPTGDEGLVAAVVATFLRDAALRLDEMRTAVSQQDAGRLRQVAHALKGSSGCVGATRMTELSGQIEQLAKMGNFHDSAESMDRLEHEFFQIRPILQNLGSPRPG